MRSLPRLIAHDEPVYEYVGPPLNRERLASLLAQNDVAERAYHLYGAHQHDALVLDHRPEGWIVFYSERGEENVLARYESEDEACLDILTRLLANEHNRYELVAGLAPAEQADAQFAEWLQTRGLDPSDLSEGDLKTDEVPWEAGARPFRRYFVHRRRIRSAT